MVLSPVASHGDFDQMWQFLACIHRSKKFPWSVFRVNRHTDCGVNWWANWHQQRHSLYASESALIDRSPHWLQISPAHTCWSISNIQDSSETIPHFNLIYHAGFCGRDGKIDTSRLIAIRSTIFIIDINNTSKFIDLRVAVWMAMYNQYLNEQECERWYFKLLATMDYLIAYNTTTMA